VCSGSSTVKQSGQSNTETGVESRYGKKHDFVVTVMELRKWKQKIVITVQLKDRSSRVVYSRGKQNWCLAAETNLESGCEMNIYLGVKCSR
jgi:hypothetical protein